MGKSRKSVYVPVVLSVVMNRGDVKLCLENSAELLDSLYCFRGSEVDCRAIDKLFTKAKLAEILADPENRQILIDDIQDELATGYKSAGSIPYDGYTKIAKKLLKQHLPELKQLNKKYTVEIKKQQQNEEIEELNRLADKYGYNLVK